MNLNLIFPLLLIFTGININSSYEQSTVRYTVANIQSAIPEKSMKLISCKSEPICSCIAAGGCDVSPGSSCRIEFCDGTVQTESFNRKVGDVTTVNIPCEEN